MPDEPADEERVEDLAVPESESEDVKGGDAAKPAQPGRTKYPDIVLKRGLTSG
jgi:hypothetical protein